MIRNNFYRYLKPFLYDFGREQKMGVEKIKMLAKSDFFFLCVFVWLLSRQQALPQSLAELFLYR